MNLEAKDAGCVVTVRWADEDLKGLLVDASPTFCRVYFQDHPDFSLRSVENDQIVECGDRLVLPALVNPVKPEEEKILPKTEEIEAFRDLLREVEVPPPMTEETCLACGGTHGSGLMCPKMVPTA